MNKKNSYPFYFKQFHITHSKSAMKVGTDGVLLGAWVKISNNVLSILDIGSGTGLLSLMVAQRCPLAKITAIEIDRLAYEECGDNFNQSLWHDRLRVIHSSLQEYAQIEKYSFDLILCNPPFYQGHHQTSSGSRNLARNAKFLPLEELFLAASGLMSPEGSFALVYPSFYQEELLAEAYKKGLYAFRILDVRGRTDGAVRRTLVQFSFTKDTVNREEISLEEARGIPTEPYRELVQDFYLKM